GRPAGVPDPRRHPRDAGGRGPRHDRRGGRGGTETRRMTAFRVVIPARYASTRLPGKPLADIGGKPMIVRVMERAVAAGAAEVLVATDDRRVLERVQAAGGRALMTRADHASGTDRLAEVVETLGWGDDEIVVNVQGDEPLIDPDLIRTVARTLADDAEAAI